MVLAVMIPVGKLKRIRQTPTTVTVKIMESIQQFMNLFLLNMRSNDWFEELFKESLSLAENSTSALELSQGWEEPPSLGMSADARRKISQIERLFRLLLVCPVSTSEAERSLSAPRRLKTALTEKHN